MTQLFDCPQRPKGQALSQPALLRENGTCSYCGSLNPEAFMKFIEANELSLIPTDKPYKVYIEGPALEGRGKFYFWHLSPEQQTRFIELYNAKKMNMPHGFFYVLPFFCRRADGLTEV